MKEKEGVDVQVDSSKQTPNEATYQLIIRYME
jgi:hypothetical protein